MKILAKLTGSFLLVAVVCAVVGGIGWLGINATQAGLVDVAKIRIPALRGLGLMTEGMNGIKAAERTLLIADLDSQARAREFENLKSRWAIFEEGYALYAPLPKSGEMAASWEKLQVAFDRWQGEHRKFVQLVQAIKLDNIETLEAILVQRQLDHVHWVAELERAVETGSEFSGQPDPTLCRFGRWQSTFSSQDSAFNALIAEMTEPHERLHALGGRVKLLLSQGRKAEAVALYRAEGKMLLAAIELQFDKALAEVRVNIDHLQQAKEVGFVSEREAFNQANGYLREIADKNNGISEAVSSAAQATASRSKVTALVAVLLGAAIAAAFGYFISREISEPLRQAVAMLAELGKGHLDRRLGMSRRDEIGELARHMDSFADSLRDEAVQALVMLAAGDLTFSANPKDGRDAIGNALQKAGADLNATMGEIRMAAMQIAAGAAQVSSSSQDLSEGSAESAAALEEISSSMAELAAQTTTNAAHAQQANRLAEQARAAAEKGDRQMAELVVAMGEINRSGENISKIIKVIDEIAFQTNLLALNAAVEAARAGRQGKGFSVVAEEVRNLATRSAKAARESAAMIEGAVGRARAGSALANLTAEALVEIVAGATQVTDLVGEIASASQEQANGFAQVKAGLQQIDQVTQQNTVAAEEGAAASETLSAQAGQLQQMLGRFKVRGAGPVATAALPAPRSPSA